MSEYDDQMLATLETEVANIGGKAVEAFEHIRRRIWDLEASLKMCQAEGQKVERELTDEQAEIKRLRGIMNKIAAQFDVTIDWTIPAPSTGEAEPTE